MNFENGTCDGRDYIIPFDCPGAASHQGFVGPLRRKSISVEARVSAFKTFDM